MTPLVHLLSWAVNALTATHFCAPLSRSPPPTLHMPCTVALNCLLEVSLCVSLCVSLSYYCIMRSFFLEKDVNFLNLPNADKISNFLRIARRNWGLIFFAWYLRYTTYNCHFHTGIDILVLTFRRNKCMKFFEQRQKSCLKKVWIFRYYPVVVSRSNEKVLTAEVQYERE